MYFHKIIPQLLIRNCLTHNDQRINKKFGICYWNAFHVLRIVEMILEVSGRCPPVSHGGVSNTGNVNELNCLCNIALK